MVVVFQGRRRVAHAQSLSHFAALSHSLPERGSDVSSVHRVLSKVQPIRGLETIFDMVSGPVIGQRPNPQISLGRDSDSSHPANRRLLVMKFVIRELVFRARILLNRRHVNEGDVSIFFTKVIVIQNAGILNSGSQSRYRAEPSSRNRSREFGTV
jgi:hypothetical protein